MQARQSAAERTQVVAVNKTFVLLENRILHMDIFDCKQLLFSYLFHGDGQSACVCRFALLLSKQESSSVNGLI